MRKISYLSIVFIIVFLFVSNTVTAESELQWEKTYGGANNEQGYSVQQTLDGGYIIAGKINSSDSESFDVLLMKTDEHGIFLWEQTFGDTFDDDFAWFVQQTSDDGYIIVGHIQYSSIDNDTDIYIIKTDSSGELQWENTYGGKNFDFGGSIQQTSDGGYIIAGCTFSYSIGSGDVYLIKTDSNGNSQWVKSFGGNDYDTGRSVQQTTDGGYIITGYTSSYGSGNYDVYLIKIDSFGELQWEKTFGGNESDYGQFVKQTSDGGFIMTGYTYSYGAGSSDVYLIKTNVSGELQWEQTYGGAEIDQGYCVQQATDGGYIIAGNTQSYGSGLTDVYLIKTCSDGYLEWEKTFGGSNRDYGESIQQTSDNGYIVAGYTYSFGAGKSDVYLIKLSDDYLTGKIIYVDDDANGVNDGSSWENAYIYLQDALADANSAEKPVEIRIAQGIYKPDQGANEAPGDREASFNLINDVNLIGCYAGITELDPNARDIELYETILSGDLDGNDIDVNDPNDLPDEPTRSENSYNIITSSDIDLTATLDGLTITAGNANGFYNEERIGGGMYIINSNIILTNCTFSNNQAELVGGGLYNYGMRNSSLENCTFSGNIAREGGGIHAHNSNPIIRNCTFENNNSERRGGAIGSRASEAVITNCIFSGNTSDYGGGIYIDSDIKLYDCQFTGNSASRGGGVFIYSSNPEINNCEFIANHASVVGGGIASSIEINPGPKLSGCTFIANLSDGSGGALEGGNSIYNSIISGNAAAGGGGAIFGYGETVNCTIVGNKANGHGGGIYVSGGAILTNNIIRNNKTLSENEVYGRNEIYVDSLSDSGQGELIVTSSARPRPRAELNFNNIQGGKQAINNVIWSTGTIDSDPCFADPGYWDPNGTPNDPNDDFWLDGDYHLKSQAGRWNPNSKEWVLDDITSICIDAGDPNNLTYDEPIPTGNRINMGAFGGTVQASKSPYDVNYFPQAFSPYPADDAVNVILDPILGWQSDMNAVAHEIYFGTDNPPPFIKKQYEMEFDPGALEPNSQYFWRIDNLDNMVNRVAGNLWTFFTGTQPVCAYNPNPIDGKDNVEYGTILSWNPGQNALLHNVYFGTDFDNVNNATEYNSLGVQVSFAQDASYYNPGKLEFDQTYYWRIEEINNDGIVSTSNTWTFQTGSFPVKAYNPNPANKAIEIPHDDIIFSWSPGLNAVTHDLYFGYNFDLVSNATIKNNIDVYVYQEQDSNFFDAPSIGYEMCYWRVDETDSNGIKTTGDVWVFTISFGGLKSGSCFLPNTHVWVDGEFVPISKVAAGQIAGPSSIAIVEKLQEHVGMYDCRDIILESGNCISVAETHLFMLESGIWIASQNLKSGMKLKTMNGSIAIKSVRKREMPYVGKVYNVTVSGTHQYMVGEDAVIVRDY